MRSSLWVLVVSLAGLAACGGADDPATTARLEVTALAGPVCPVETDPPTPGCEPKLVESAVIVVNDDDGNEVARRSTGADGVVVFDVVPGGLTVVPQPVEGLLGTAGAVAVTLTADQAMQITVEYDTGIR